MIRAWFVLLATLVAGSACSGSSNRATSPFPEPQPIRSANPAKKEKLKFELPKRLVATPDAGSYRIDETSLQTVEVDVTKKLATGIRYRHAGGYGYASGTRLAEGPTLTAAPGAQAELTIVVFETDIPPQHHWTPESGTAYRELWSTTLRAP